MKILIATDGSDFSQAAVTKCCEMMIDPADTEVKLLSVYHAHTPPGTFSLSVAYFKYFEVVKRRLRDQAENAVACATSLIRKCFPEDDIKIFTQVESGRAAQSIVKTAEDWAADLVVVGSHGYGFWDRAMIGSVSSAVVRHAPCSVLVVRGKKLMNS